MRQDEETWTPYGLEALRQEALKRRRILALALVGALAIGYLSLAQTTTTTETEIFANGRKASIELEIPPQQKAPGPDATVQVQPGRVTRAASGEAPEEAAPASTAPPPYVGEPVNWLAWLMFLGPIALFGTILWVGFRGKAGPADEVNYGVYKGAMPLELITASHAHMVVTPKRAQSSLFGKRRDDYVPEDP